MPEFPPEAGKRAKANLESMSPSVTEMLARMSSDDYLRVTYLIETHALKVHHANSHDDHIISMFTIAGMYLFTSLAADVQRKLRQQEPNHG